MVDLSRRALARNGKMVGCTFRAAPPVAPTSPTTRHRPLGGLHRSSNPSTPAVVHVSFSHEAASSILSALAIVTEGTPAEDQLRVWNENLAITRSADVRSPP